MIAAALATVMALAAGDSDWVTDAQGRTFRVGFDPGSRWFLGVGYSVDPSGPVGDGDLRLEQAWLVRDEDRDNGRTWKLSHTLGSVLARSGARWRLDATLYRGEYLRWSKDGGIVIPTIPPTRLSFPIDIGWSLEVGRVRTALESDKFTTEVTPLGAEILFDFWRSRHVGSYLVLGVGPRYEIALDRQERALHVVTPFSRARLTLHHEWCQGKQVFEASAEASTAWTTDEVWRDHAAASVSWEWTFLAVNDDPLSLRLAGDWRWDELYQDATHDGHELTATAGLRLGL